MTEPVTLAAAKKHLRVDADDEDTLIEGIISDARAWVEDYTGQILVQRTVVEAIDAFDGRIRAWPITSIDSVSYRDADGVSTALAAETYTLFNARRPARMVRTPSLVWPTLGAGPGPVVMTMTAGYADPADIPRGLIRAMMFLIGGYYADRETGGLAGDVETAARHACGPKSRTWSL